MEMLKEICYDIEFKLKKNPGVDYSLYVIKIEVS